MELENLKELWNKGEQELPEISLKKQDEIHSPLEMIRINMQTEFWILLLTLPMLLIGFPFATKDISIRIISFSIAFLTLLIIIYFYSRLLKLYKLLKKRGVNTNYDLFNIKTQLLVSKEIYISYYISYIPLAFLSCLERIHFEFNSGYNIAIFIGSFLITILLLCFLIKYWTYYMYGKYIQQVVDLVDELNGLEVIPNRKKNNSWFERSQKYFMKKFGIKGNVLNTIIWLISVYIFVTIFFLIVILIIVFIGEKLDIIDLKILLKALNQE
ncbi:hypothetical protein [Chryseobacterium sp. RR2-3-20]|uniref:hypothetical protein n=1 Tax=Chryseobacterium sp. RR2-3-20 TaxID=2787626 RepID=UPI001AE04265|nr:hypothetical protein [Chryseobacterium sp. RR2-3-20]